MKDALLLLNNKQCPNYVNCEQDISQTQAGHNRLRYVSWACQLTISNFMNFNILMRIVRWSYLPWNPTDKIQYLLPPLLNNMNLPHHRHSSHLLPHTGRNEAKVQEGNTFMLYLIKKRLWFVDNDTSIVSDTSTYNNIDTTLYSDLIFYRKFW